LQDILNSVQTQTIKKTKH